MAKPALSQFLISYPGRRQCGEQAELRALDGCLSQLVVINPRYNAGETSQVLTRTGQANNSSEGCFPTVFDFILYAYTSVIELSSSIRLSTGHLTLIGKGTAKRALPENHRHTVSDIKFPEDRRHLGATRKY